MDEKSDHETDPEWNEKNDRSLVRIDLKVNRLINQKNILYGQQHHDTKNLQPILW